MKNFIKFAAVGIAGYLIGFYEMKYKVIKVMLTKELDNREDNKEEK